MVGDPEAFAATLAELGVAQRQLLLWTMDRAVSAAPTADGLAAARAIREVAAMAAEGWPPVIAAAPLVRFLDSRGVMYERKGN